jgi:hypothetical protein
MPSKEVPEGDEIAHFGASEAWYNSMFFNGLEKVPVLFRGA